MRAARVLVALALAPAPALAAPETYDIEPRHTFPHFAVEHLGISTQRGRFERTRGTIVLDREAGTGAIDIDIDAGSVSTGTAALDAVLRGEEFLDAGRHPTVAFRSRRLTFEGGTLRAAEGELTIAGATRPVTLRVERFGCTRLPFLVRLTCGAEARASIRRSAFGLDAWGGLVGDEVRLEIQVEAVRREPEAGPVPSGG